MPSAREKTRLPFPHNFRGSASFRSPLSLPVALRFLFAVKDKYWGCGGEASYFLPPEVFQKKKSKLTLSTVSDTESARLTGSTLIFLSHLWLRLQVWGVTGEECFCAHCEKTWVSTVHECMFHFEHLMVVHRSCWYSSISLRTAGNLLCFDW